MKNTVPSRDDDRIFIDVAVDLGEGKELSLRIRRYDFLAPDAADAFDAGIEELDVEAQLIAVANDLDETPVGVSVFWQPLKKVTRARLSELGVKVTRVSNSNGKQDEVVAPSKKVLEALLPYSDQPVLPMRKRMRGIRLAMLKHIVTPEQFEVCQTLTDGQLAYICDQWQTQSNIALGEFLASESS